MIKFCRKCQKDTERDAAGGCKPCSAARKAANPERTKRNMANWLAANREKQARFHAEYHKANAQKKKDASAAWRAANPQRLKETVSAWRDEHPEAVRAWSNNRRARQSAAGGAIDEATAPLLLRLQRGKCPVCRADLQDGYHIDHVVALAKGGSNEIENLQLLCPRCNCQKSTKDPIVFMQSRGYLL